ncbi:TlpA family protein disulfide reductase [Pontibacter cellulosilyticus]|uniref:TlpA family protein disulfide reductase n=1 Tax=Pontibacter cellulosilyticus TaxID=1720253 RepID=A0A923SJW4_9BACT|nr:TlpA disulfide reductase family protein [Pontibacter cellulosilyticus]MBC5993176.1 TlpA family protein disulfide reductase [Pontibacter cellulosilyticus]
MQLKRGVLILVFSTVAMFALATIGYFGHHYKFSAVTILYFLLTLYFLGKTATLQEKVWVIFLILLPPAVLYLPLHLMSFEGTKQSVPSSAAHLIGIGSGTLVNISGKSLKVGLVTLILFLCIWTTSKGYDLWLNKLSFGTYTGSVSEQLPQFSLSDSEGNVITSNNFNEKLIVLDFWTTSCGICFKKFPVLQEKAKPYKNHSKVEFYAVNIPVARDTLGQGQRTIESLGYSFSNLFASGEDVAKAFGVRFYPTVLILKNGNEIVYRGSIEGIDDEIDDYLDL